MREQLGWLHANYRRGEGWGYRNTGSGVISKKQKQVQVVRGEHSTEKEVEGMDLGTELSTMEGGQHPGI